MKIKFKYLKYILFTLVLVLLLKAVYDLYKNRNTIENVKSLSIVEGFSQVDPPWDRGLHIYGGNNSSNVEPKYETRGLIGNPGAKDHITSNKIISNSNYATATQGRVIGGRYYSASTDDDKFQDGDNTTRTAVSNKGSPFALVYEFFEEQLIKGYTIKIPGGNKRPKGWRLRGVLSGVDYSSNDDSTYSELHSSSPTSRDNEEFTYDIGNTIKYKKYILHIFGNWGDSTYTEITEWILYGDIFKGDDSPPLLNINATNDGWINNLSASTGTTNNIHFLKRELERGSYNFEIYSKESGLQFNQILSKFPWGTSANRIFQHNGTNVIDITSETVTLENETYSTIEYVDPYYRTIQDVIPNNMNIIKYSEYNYNTILDSTKLVIPFDIGSNQLREFNTCIVSFDIRITILEESPKNFWIRVVKSPPLSLRYNTPYYLYNADHGDFVTRTSALDEGDWRQLANAENASESMADKKVYLIDYMDVDNTDNTNNIYNSDIIIKFGDSRYLNLDDNKAYADVNQLSQSDIENTSIFKLIKHSSENKFQIYNSTQKKYLKYDDVTNHVNIFGGYGGETQYIFVFDENDGDYFQFRETIDCYLNEINYDHCNANCTVEQTKFIEEDGGSCAPITYDCQPGDGECPLPVDCMEGNSVEWESCVPTNGECGSGEQEGERNGDTPAQYGGEACISTAETRDCNIPCPVDCQFGSTVWGDCELGTGDCGSGEREGSMTITQQGSHGGSACPTDLSITENCNIQCPDFVCNLGSMPTADDCTASGGILYQEILSSSSSGCIGSNYTCENDDGSFACEETCGSGKGLMLSGSNCNVYGPRFINFIHQNDTPRYSSGNDGNCVGENLSFNLPEGDYNLNIYQKSAAGIKLNNVKIEQISYDGWAYFDLGEDRESQRLNINENTLLVEEGSGVGMSLGSDSIGSDSNYAIGNSDTAIVSPSETSKIILPFKVESYVSGNTEFLFNITTVVNSENSENSFWVEITERATILGSNCVYSEWGNIGDCTLNDVTGSCGAGTIQQRREFTGSSVGSGGNINNLNCDSPEFLQRNGYCEIPCSTDEGTSVSEPQENITNWPKKKFMMNNENCRNPGEIERNGCFNKFPNRIEKCEKIRKYFKEHPEVLSNWSDFQNECGFLNINNITL